MAYEAKKRNKANYTELATTDPLRPLAVETTGVFGSEAWAFYRELSCQIQHESVPSPSISPTVNYSGCAMGNAATVLDTSSPNKFDFSILKNLPQLGAHCMVHHQHYKALSQIFKASQSFQTTIHCYST